ncbi:MAG: AraC family transcriptional regulator [Pedobacter sp.]|uniref:helix-turn-helix transcriptional regulator n=1 Tax=Pedobacter sp. TaxID=1411316 RepID=UPI003562FF23
MELCFSSKRSSTMHSHITFYLNAMLIRVSDSGQHSHLKNISLNGAATQLLLGSDSRIQLQSISHYLVLLGFFELDLPEKTSFDMIIEQSSFLMFIMLNGESTLHNEFGDLISESKGNSCTLCFLSAGHYTWEFKSPKHKMIILNFNPDYFIDRCKEIPQFKGMTDAHQSGDIPYILLPHCKITTSIFNLFKKYFKHINSGTLSQFTAIESISTNCLAKYEQALINERYTTNALNKKKKAEIISFIHQHYTEKIVENQLTMASMFNISISTLDRLLKKTIKMTLRQYVIKLRMDEAMLQITTSQIAIKDIAANIGYPDPLHFSRLFKNHFSLAPSDVKRNH